MQKWKSKKCAWTVQTDIMRRLSLYRVTFHVYLITIYIFQYYTIRDIDT